MRIFAGHQGAVRGLTTTSDGKLIISAGEDGTVQMRDIESESGEAVAVLRGHRGRIWAVSLGSVDTELVSGGDDGTIRIWQSIAQDQVLEIDTGQGSVWAVATTMDGSQLISAGDDGTVRIWDRDTRCRATLEAHHGRVRAVALTTDGTRLISSGADGAIRVWDLASNECVFTLSEHRGPVWALALRDGRSTLVSAGADNDVRIWSLRQDSPDSRLIGHPGRARALAISPGGEHLVTGGEDGHVRLWNLDTLEVVGDSFEHLGRVWALTVNAAGTVVSGGEDGRIVVHDRDLASPEQHTRGRRGEYLPGITSDSEADLDGLGLYDETRAVASLVAAPETRAPLSIAILGNWGSGKSTFMKLVQQHVAKFQDAPFASGAHAPRIRQIRFNAWHFSDDYVWTGLVDHLFREMKRAPVDRHAVPANRRELELELAAERAQCEHSERILRAVTETESPRIVRWPYDIRRSWTLVKESGRGFREQVSFRAAAIGVTFLVLAVVSFAMSLKYDRATAGWIIGGAATLVGVLAPTVSLLRRAGQLLEGACQRLVSDVEMRQRKIAHLEEQLVAFDPVARLDALLDEMAAADRYGSYRGLVGRIHDDLRRLNDELTQGDPAHQLRVILYVDDLDRCPSPKVVEVLQALNLLLSMPLFVVIAAVDPRWLIRALGDHYGQLLGNDTDKGIGPLEYLDKIFHLAFALRPLDSSHSRYLYDLLIPAEDDAIGSSEEATRASTEAASPGLVVQAVDTARPLASTASDGTEAVDAATGNPQPGSGFATLRLRREEAEFISLLVPLLATPRAIKRLSNVYRLIRIGILESDVNEFIGDNKGGPFQAVALLLAAVMGAPGNARELLRAIIDSPQGQTDITEILSEARANIPSAAILLEFIEKLRTKMSVYGCSESYREWSRRIARYSFETYDLFRG